MSAGPVITANTVLFSLKTFLAAMTAYFIAVSFDLPRPFWAVATVYIVAHPLSGAISSKSAYRLLGTIIGGMATVAVVPNLVNEPILLCAAIVAWVSTCTFVSLLDRTPRSYVFLLAGYTVLLAGLPLVNDPANTFDTVVSRIEEIGLAIICASLVSHIVLPSHAGTVVVSRTDDWLTKAMTLFAATAAGKIDEIQGRKQRLDLAADAADLRSFTTHLQYDGSRYRSAVLSIRALQRRMVLSLSLMAELADLRRSLERLDTSRARQALSMMADMRSISGSGAPDAMTGFAAKIDALSPSDATRSWEELVLANAFRNLRDILRVWDDCRTIRRSVDNENAARTARRTIDLAGTPAPHRDVGMAMLSAAAVAICLSSSMLFWIASGWSDGMSFAQISGVLCCLLAAMDDPVPAMRKFVGVTICAMVAAFVYGFSVLPMIDGFMPLAAALALFLIPAGICLATPSLALVGMGLCINFPLLLTLQARQSSDVTTFLNTSIATILAMLWTIIVCGLFRSVSAQTNARRFRSVTQKHVARIATGSETHADSSHYRIVDIAGLFASRAAKLPPTSDIAAADLIRDLRTGLHVMTMQRLMDDASQPFRLKAQTIFKLLEQLYAPKTEGRRESVENAIGLLDDFMAFASEKAVSTAERELVVNAAALRLCLAPDADPPVLPMPTGRRTAA